MGVIDGNNLVLGRAASVIAQRLLKGEKIDVLNAEKMIISGNEKVIVEKFRRRINLHEKGNPETGPKLPKRPDRLVKKSITGMLPKGARGRDAEKRLKCYIGVPEEFKNQAAEKINEADRVILKFITVEEVSKKLGAMW